MSEYDTDVVVWSERQGELLRRIARGPREYLEAWVGSGLVSLVGHFSGVLAPWGVVWCYLARSWRN